MSGTPSANTAYDFQFSNQTFPATTTGISTTTNECVSLGNYLNGNVAEPGSLANCSVANANQAAYQAGEPSILFGVQQIWLQQSLPKSGLYLRAGHLQQSEGPVGLTWLGGDYFWGAMLGISHGPLNAYLTYGVGNAAVTNNSFYNVPVSEQVITAEADYSFNVGRGSLNVGGLYTNYTGVSVNAWIRPRLCVRVPVGV